MVLEKIVPEAWLEHKPLYGFLLGVGYTILGIVLAAIIFRKDPAIPSVAFTSIFLIPLMHKLFRREEVEKSRDKRFSWKLLYTQNKDIFWTYFFVFLGIFMVFSVASATLPSFTASKLFREQLGLRAGAATGFVVSDAGFEISSDESTLREQRSEQMFYSDLFWRILKNNWWVFLATLILAILAGEGGVFFVTWNASVWGTIFGMTARTAAQTSSDAPLYLLAIILFITLPHVFLEMGSYLLAGTGGGIFSSAVGKERLTSHKMREVVIYCGGLVLVGLVFLVAGALVETYVLGNSVSYQTIIANGYFGR